MAQAHAVLMPSRFETFGIVAAEALAVGVPLVAFDTGPLREVAGGGGASLVQPFELDRFTTVVLNVISEHDGRDRAREKGRAWTQRYRWDEIAMRQERHYLQTVERSIEQHARGR
jgi:glycosyltransferase involved in cell wall biosynthesis